MTPDELRDYRDWLLTETDPVRRDENHNTIAAIDTHLNRLNIPKGT